MPSKAQNTDQGPRLEQGFAQAEEEKECCVCIRIADLCEK